MNLLSDPGLMVDVLELTVPMMIGYGLFCSLFFDLGRTIYRRLKFGLRRLFRRGLSGLIHV